MKTPSSASRTSTPGAPSPPAPEEGDEPLRYLVVDDDEVFRERLARALRQRGAQVHTAASAAEGAAAARSHRFDRGIVDLRMPGGSGLELIHALQAPPHGPSLVVLTGYASIPTAVEAMRAGAHSYLAKPATLPAILAAFEAGAPPNDALATGGEPGAAPAERDEEIPTPSLASVEWEHIHRVLADCDGNISAAAKRLGLHRRSLQRKLAKYPPPR